MFFVVIAQQWLLVLDSGYLLITPATRFSPAPFTQDALPYVQVMLAFAIFHFIL